MKLTLDYQKQWIDYVLWPIWVILYYLYLVLFAVLSFVLNLASYLLCWLPHTQGVSRFFKHFIFCLIRFYVGVLQVTGIMRIRYVGFDRLPDDCRLLVCNHPSLFDVFLIYNKFTNLICIFKASLRRSILRGTLAERIGFVENASGAGTIKAAIQKIKNGDRLLIFPEGTRTVADPVNPFKPGAALIASKAKVPLQTVLIRTNSHFLGKGASFWKLPVLPTIFEVEVGEAIEPASAESVKMLNTQLENYFKEHIMPKI